MRGWEPSGTPTLQSEIAQKNGLAGIRQAVSIMRSYVEEYKTEPDIRELALELVRDLPQKDFAGEVRACWDYVKYRVRYTRDVYGVETLQTPIKTLEYGQGDCDDKATLLAAMLESIGHKTRLYACGFREDEICHVLPQVWLNGKWVSLETTEPVQMGWTPPAVRCAIYG